MKNIQKMVERIQEVFIVKNLDVVFSTTSDDGFSVSAGEDYFQDFKEEEKILFFCGMGLINLAAERLNHLGFLSIITSNKEGQIFLKIEDEEGDFKIVCEIDTQTGFCDTNEHFTAVLSEIMEILKEQQPQELTTDVIEVIKVLGIYKDARFDSPLQLQLMTKYMDAKVIAFNNGTGAGFIVDGTTVFAKLKKDGRIGTISVY